MLSTVVHSSVSIFAGNLCCVMQVAAAAAALSTRYSIVKISEDVYFDLPKLFTVREKPCGRDAQVIINDYHFMDTIQWMYGYNAKCNFARCGKLRVVTFVFKSDFHLIIHYIPAAFILHFLHTIAIKYSFVTIFRSNKIWFLGFAWDRKEGLIRLQCSRTLRAVFCQIFFPGHLVSLSSLLFNS